MDYKLVQINRLDEASAMADNDFIIAEVDDPTANDRYKTVKFKAEVAFQTTNIRASNSGKIDIDVNDPIFDNSNLPSELKTQDDINELFAKTIQALVDHANSTIRVFYSDTPPTLPDDILGNERYHPEGTLWIDTNTFRVHSYYYNINQFGIIRDRYWISLTDR